MNLANRGGRALAAAGIASLVAMTLGIAGGARADDSDVPPASPVSTEAAAPPVDTASEPGGDEATTTVPVMSDEDQPDPAEQMGAPTTVPESQGPSAPDQAPTTTSPAPPQNTSNAVAAPPTTMASLVDGQAPQPESAGAVPQLAALVVSKPSAPRSPAATPANASVKLSWLAPASNGGANVNLYAVQRSTSATGPWKSIAFPTGTSYTASGLTNGIKYYFRTRAHNSAGWGPASSVVNAIPRTVPTAPRSPAAIPGYGTVKLTWLKPTSNGGAAVDKYAVQSASSPSGPWVKVDDTIGTTYTVTGITPGVSYNFRIVAHNAAGWGVPSSVVDIPVAVSVPGAPLTCSASQVGNFGSHSMWVDWQPPLSDGGAPITGYILDLNGPLSLGLSLPPTPLELQRNNLPPGYYVVRVAAVTAVGKGPWCSDGVVIN